MLAHLLARVYHVERDPVHKYEDEESIFKDKVTTLQERMAIIAKEIEDVEKERVELVVVCPNIEHNMLGIILVSCCWFLHMPWEK